MQEVLPDAGSTTYEDMLAVLALHLARYNCAGATCLSAQ